MSVMTDNDFVESKDNQASFVTLDAAFRLREQ
jgi:hypothetical protein